MQLDVWDRYVFWEIS